MKHVSAIPILLSIILHACQQKDPEPKPTADYEANYLSNGQVVFNLSTSNADSFTWDFGDGTSSNERIPKHQYAKNGRYVATVNVKGKGGEAVVAKSIRVQNITGSVVFWMQSMRNKDIEVTVDGKYSEIITGYYSSGVAPDCNATYCANFSGLSEGTHTFEARELSALFPCVWESTITIIGNDCRKQKLTY